MGLYVCFDDSDSDPTYSPASAAYLVEGDNTNGGNPCSLQNSKRAVSVIPQTFEEIRDFADFMGWDAGMDAMGNVVLYTNIKK
jgi:hypothetical protein